MKSILLVLLIFLCGIVYCQEDSYVSINALGLYKKDIVRSFGNAYTLKSNDNGSAFLDYELSGTASSGGRYSIKCTFFLNSDYRCYYISETLPASEYNRTIKFLDYRCKLLGNNKWMNSDGYTIEASLNTYSSGSIFTLTFYP